MFILFVLSGKITSILHTRTAKSGVNIISKILSNLLSTLSISEIISIKGISIVGISKVHRF